MILLLRIITIIASVIILFILNIVLNLCLMNWYDKITSVKSKYFVLDDLKLFYYISLFGIFFVLLFKKNIKEVRKYNNLLSSYKDYYGRDLTVIKSYKRRIRLISIKNCIRGGFRKKFFKYFTVD